MRVARVPSACAVAFLAAFPSLVAGTPHAAHLHYMVGVRAYAGTRHAAMLHHEAATEGLDLGLARENAVDMEELATEIGSWLDRIEKQQPPAERVKIAAQLATMKEKAASLRAQVASLAEMFDAAMATWKGPATAAVREDTAERCRQYFADFQSILAAHKEAEKILGIPVPADPPPPEAAPGGKE